MPMRAPRCLESAAIVIIVSTAARNSRSWRIALFWPVWCIAVRCDNRRISRCIHVIRVVDLIERGLAMA